MPPTRTGVHTALRGLHDALEAPHPPGTPHETATRWRHSVRARMKSLRDCLDQESSPPDESWLTPRSTVVLRERDRLLGRMSALSPQVKRSGELDTVRAELKRLLVDISHHVQRFHDLAYDDVELELGGSE